MFNPIDVVDFFELLDELDFVSIEENQWGEDVTLDRIKSFNSGNNCLHYILIHNNHRIVIQTYKDKKMNHKKIDIVQGKPELEYKFEDMIESLNAQPQIYNDDRLNKLFVLYCGMWQKCSAFYWGEMDSFFCEFGPSMTVSWTPDYGWIIDGSEKLSVVQFVIDFINAVEDICNG
jgi:hypothetical protein